MSGQALMEQRVARDKALHEKWSRLTESLGTLKGEHILESAETKETTKSVLSRMLENVQKEEGLKEATTDTSAVAQFKKYAYPLIRRIYPTLSINDLVAVQPLEGPVGQIFTFQAKYGTTKGQTTAGTTVYNNVDRFYSSAIIDQQEVRAAAAASTDYSCNLPFAPVIPSTVTLVVDPTGTPITATDDGVGGLSGAGIASGTIDYATGAVVLTLSATNVNEMVGTWTYNNEGNTNLPELTFDITSQAVQVTDRVIRAKWTPQALQDMMSQHQVEGDRAFTDEMARSVQREMAQDVVQKLFAVAGDSGLEFSKARPDYISYDDHKRVLVDRFTELSNQIYLNNLRGVGNVLVAGLDAVNILQTLPTFRPDGETINSRPNGRIGVLNNQWIIIKDIHFASDKVMMGYKGDTFLEAGAVFSPYALTLSDALLNPDDMVIRKGLISRDAFTVTNDKHYLSMTITA